MTKYIWHTQEDDKVRPWHASRDGKVFDSEHPPKGGNPGESPNCRCWAESIEEENENKGKTYLLFDGQKLMWYENGQKVKEWSAMSGDKDCQSRKCIPLENIGPIPEGKWYVKQINHQKFVIYFFWIKERAVRKSSVNPVWAMPEMTNTSFFVTFLSVLTFSAISSGNTESALFKTTISGFWANVLL